MVETATKVPVKSESNKPAPAKAPEWGPVETLRTEIDRLFEDFNRSNWPWPFRPRAFGAQPFFRRTFEWAAPAVNVVEKDKAYEISAEVPGIDGKNIEVMLRNGNIVIKGEKQEEKEEKSKDYYLHERQFGSFERAFAVPNGVETEKIEASFRNGVLTVVLPKTAEAQKPEKKITVKAA
ncbi:Hsp20/alpha crystallin family protein [Devosia nitrariae]|uniref:Molecular chaperone Hsp20 n=1 Tax=Devosia nitrariae TaxID=2071872 RepID=A0ABQ5W977_9HYPH|nr:Hsp20/alpha crystallin family protein [Devosia nitrariae]GLQ56586.1 molecular chaperone Hsp20 [Devosia nitrariae]